jgi:hypothetical protein
MNLALEVIVGRKHDFDVVSAQRYFIEATSLCYDYLADAASLPVCGKEFSITSGTLFASHKPPLRGYLAGNDFSE